MHQPPDAEEPLPEGLRLAIEGAQEAWARLLFQGLEDVGQNYAELLESVIDLAQQTPADMRDEAIRYANGSTIPPKITMNSVVRMYDDYDDIRDALREFFRTFGSFRKQFTEGSALQTILWATREVGSALAECASFYHVEFEAASIDDI